MRENQRFTDFNPRSPHGERPTPAAGRAAGAADFNPRSPHGERPLRQADAPPEQMISIHAPRTGSDRIRVDGAGGAAISIHAPRTGSDPKSFLSFLARQNFNPRSPHGERRYRRAWRRRVQANFNPRSPHGERRRTTWTTRAARANFNPRSPHGERRTGRCSLQLR